MALGAKQALQIALFRMSDRKYIRMFWQAPLQHLIFIELWMSLRSWNNAKLRKKCIYIIF